MAKIKLSSPFKGGNELQYVKSAILNGEWSVYGDNIDNFENELGNYLGDKTKLTLLNSGTSALHLSLILANIIENDIVFCQSHTYVASANPIKYQGATPVFIDSEVDTWNICPFALEEGIKDQLAKGNNPKAIIAVHLYGMPYKVEAIRAIADKYNLVLIEDSAEALGSTYKGRACGTFGDYGILSFNGNKIITTSGGGALVVKSEQEKQKAVFLATQARDNSPHYQHSEIGYNYRMSNICAGIGCGQLEVLDQRIAQRRAMHTFYATLFQNNPQVSLFTEPNDAYFSNHWLSAILLESYEQREALRLHLEKENIESRPLWKPMHLQPVFKDCAYYGSNVSEDLFERGLCLPSGSNLTDEDRDRIRQAIVEFFGT